MAGQIYPGAADWERDALALVGRAVQLVLPNPNDSGIVVAAILRHHYLHEDLQDVIDDCDLDELSLEETRVGAIAAIKQAVNVTLKDVQVPQDAFSSQQQLFQSLCKQVQWQSDNCTCGEPTAIFSHALLALVESIPDLISHASNGSEDFLCEQVEELKPVFKRIAAGKAFDSCKFHTNCCQSAQTHLTMAFFIIALESYATQVKLYELGLLPYLVNSLRSVDLNCKTSALRLVWLALAARIGPDDIEHSYVHASTVKTTIPSGADANEGLLHTGFTAIEDMMRLQKADITLAEVSVIMQLATSAILWPSPKPKLLERRLPWKLFSQMLVEVLRLPLVNSAPFNQDRLLLPTKGCLSLDDLIPDAMCLLSALTGTFLNAMRLHDKEPDHFKDFILPLVMTTLQKHYQQPWGGVLVMLLTSFMGQLGKGVVLKLKKEVPQESFQDAVWTGLNTDVMTRLLGPIASGEKRSTDKQMRGLCYKVLCNGYRPTLAQTRQIDMMLVAWHLTEAWLPGRVGHGIKLKMLQDWLSKNIGDHPWLAHMHHHWCNQKFVFSKDSTVPQIAGPDQQDTTKDISTAASSQTPTAPKLLKPAPEPPVPAAPDLLTLTDDEILIYHDPDSSTDVQVHRGILQELQDAIGKPVDARTFKRQLVIHNHQIQQQYMLAYKIFDAFVRQLTELKWNIFSGTPKTPVILAKFWVSSGFEALGVTLEAVLLQGRSTSITAAECKPFAEVAELHKKLLEQKAMVGKVIDTCQSRLLSWTLSSSKILDEAKKAAQPPAAARPTCPKHPNGCPVAGSQPRPGNPTAAAAAQAALPAANPKPVAVQAAAASTASAAGPAAQAAATVNGVAKQAPTASTAAAAPAKPKADPLKAADIKRKSVSDQHHANEAAQKEGTVQQPAAASPSQDTGAPVQPELPEDPNPMFEAVLAQLRSLPECDQANLVSRVHSRSKMLGALRIANPTCYDKICQVAKVRIKAAKHPALGECMEGLALTYTLANSPRDVIKDLHESGASVKELITSKLRELIDIVKEALPQKQTVAEASSSIAEPTSEQNPPGGPSTATAKPTHGLAPTAGTTADLDTAEQEPDDTSTDGSDEKPGQKMGAKARKRANAAARKEQQEQEAGTGAPAAAAKRKLVKQQQQAATTEDSDGSGVIAAHRPATRAAADPQSTTPTDLPPADDKGKGKLVMQPPGAAGRAGPPAQAAKVDADLDEAWMVTEPKLTKKQKKAAAAAARQAAQTPDKAADNTPDAAPLDPALIKLLDALDANPQLKLNKKQRKMMDKHQANTGAQAVSPAPPNAAVTLEPAAVAGPSDKSKQPEASTSLPTQKQPAGSNRTAKAAAASSSSARAPTTAEAAAAFSCILSEASAAAAAKPTRSLVCNGKPVLPLEHPRAPEQTRRSPGAWSPEATALIVTLPEPGKKPKRKTTHPPVFLGRAGVDLADLGLTSYDLAHLDLASLSLVNYDMENFNLPDLDLSGINFDDMRFEPFPEPEPVAHASPMVNLPGSPVSTPPGNAEPTLPVKPEPTLDAEPEPALPAKPEPAPPAKPEPALPAKPKPTPPAKAKSKLPGKPEPRKRRAAAEAKAIKAEAVADGAPQAPTLTDDEILKQLEENFTCPITQDLFSDPVLAADDNTYERAAITAWLVKSKTSPMTNLPLEHVTLVPNTRLKGKLEALLKKLSPEKHPSLAA